MTRIRDWSRARARLYAIVALLWLGVAPATAQAQVINTVTLSALSTTCVPSTDCAIFDMASYPSITMQFGAATYTATIVFEGTSNGATWQSISCVKLSDGSTATGTSGAGATVTQQFACQNPGLLKVRARMSAYTSGSVEVTATRGWSLPLLLSPTFTNVNLPTGGCVVWNSDTWLQRQSAGNLGISGASCGGATNGTLSANILIPDGTAAAPSLALASDTATGLLKGSVASTLEASAGGTSTLRIGNGYMSLIGTTPALYLGTSFAGVDVALTRDAANTLALRNGTAAQTVNIYGTYTSAANYKALKLSGNATDAWIYSQTATSGAIALSFGTNAQRQWQINTSGHWVAVADNTYDIGASGATRPRTAYFGTSVITPVVSASAATILTLSTNGKLGFTNAAATAGLVLDATTNGEFTPYRADGTTVASLRFGSGAGIIFSTYASFSTNTNNVIYTYNSAGNQGAALDLSTRGTWWLKSDALADTAILKANGAQFTSLNAASGVNYVCTSTTGVLSKNNTACVGTDAEAIASIPSLRAEIADLRAQLATIVRRD